MTHRAGPTRHAPRALSALLLAVCGLFASAAPTARAQPKEESSGFLPPETCKPCHPQHYEEWRGSMHAYALHDPVFHAMHALGQEETGGELGDFCVRCHSPIGVSTGEVGPHTRGVEGLSPVAAAGVSCEVCHRDVRLEAVHPANASLRMHPGGPLVGGLPDPQPNNFHESLTDDRLRSPDFCGACHNVVNQRGVPVEKPHIEHLASPYPSRGRACMDCHMQTYTGRATPDGPIRKDLHRHDFIGVDVAVTPFPRRGYQRREIEAFLRTAAQLRLEAPERAVAGRDLEIQVHVKNVGAGHNLPTGPSTEREMWVELEILRGDGSVLFRSGDLDANGDLKNRHSELEPESDAQLALFTDHFVDAEGGEVYFMWQAHRVVENTIPPLETRTASYRVPVPPEAAGEELRARARLRFRAFPPHQLRRLGIDHLRGEFPIFDMAERESGAIPVLELDRIRGRVRVPRDAPDLATAFETAADGDTISIAPGTWLVDRTLDFRGRALRVVGERGAEETRVVLDEASRSSEEAALFVLRSGEGPESVIEGLTLVGGRGLATPDGRLGGAVVALGSHPTILDCVFEANTATDRRGTIGRGGAIYLSDSRARLLGSVFRDNRAGERGGAVCAEGDSRVLIEGCEFVANLAGEGGAVALMAGGHVRESLFHAQRAHRGSAILVRSGATASPGPTAVEACDVWGGSAAGDGAILAEGDLSLTISRTVLAGNIGGAVAARFGAWVHVDRSTIVDHRLGEGPLALDLASSLRARNSIFWGNRPTSLVGEIEHSIVDDPNYAGETNLQTDPAFVSPAGAWERCRGPQEGCVPILRPEDDLEPANPFAYRRYRRGRLDLFANSPAIDRGDPRSDPDVDGTRADLGAIPKLRSSHLFLRGDIDGDGVIRRPDVAALVELLEAPGEHPCREAADIDGDGRLAVADALWLILHVELGRPELPPPWPNCDIDPQLLGSLGCFEDRCTVP